MSIPTPFNPMGTLGGGYVQSGLAFNFDASMEPDSNPCLSVTDQVTGAACAVAWGSVLAGGKLNVNTTAIVMHLPSALSAMTDEVQVEMVIRITSGGLRVFALGGTPGADKNYAYIYRQSDTLARYGFADNAGNRIRTSNTNLRPDGLVGYSANKRAIYVDGRSEALVSGTFSWASFEANTVKGCYDFKGDICALRVYSRNLTSAEVFSNYMVDKKKFGL